MDREPTNVPTGQESEDPGPGDSRVRGWLKTITRWSPLIILVLGGIAIPFFGLSDQLSMPSIIQSRTELLDYVAERPFSTVAVYVGVYIAAVVLSVPGGSLLTVVGGILFGGVIGGVVTTAAAVAGSVLVFLIARTALSGWVQRRTHQLGPRATGFAEGLRTNAFYVIVILRLIPVIPYWASNALPAVFAVRLWIFTTATMIGLLPWTVSFAFFGEALDGIVVAQELATPGCAAAGNCALDFTTLTSGPVITGVIIALLALIPVGLHWWVRRRKRDESGVDAPSAKV